MMFSVAHPGEAPTLRLDVARIPQLSAWPRPNDYFLDRAAQLRRKLVPEQLCRRPSLVQLMRAMQAL